MKHQLRLILILLQLVSVLSEQGGYTGPSINYPIKLAYVNKIQDWSSPEGLAKSIGVPGYSNHSYNYIILTFWTFRDKALDAALLWDNPIAYFGTQKFGSTNQEIRTNLKALYSSKGIKLMVSAFGATEMPTSQGVNVTKCSTQLADYVRRNQLDGVDIDWEDTAAFQQTHFKGQEWLIELTNNIRAQLPTAIITHAPQAPYFGGVSLYPSNGYLEVNRVVGKHISFYNVQFYNQQSTPYNPAEGLFNVSGGWAAGTSVNEMFSNGIPLEKIVVGKPATPSDAYDQGSYMAPENINNALVAAYKHNGWKTGVMFWQFSSDSNSSIIQTSIRGLQSLLSNNNEPIRFTCINQIYSSDSDSNILKSMGVPSIINHGYNHISFYSWTFRSGSQGPLRFWVEPRSFFTTSFKGTKTNSDLRNQIKSMYSSAGIKVLVHVFGTSQMPTTSGYSAAEVAGNLALFVLNYNFDGINIDYKDNLAFRTKTAEQWLIDFTSKLRQLLPNSLIVHTVNAAYFVGEPNFLNGAYLTVNQQVGTKIDFYNVVYFRQGNSVYNTSQTLFTESSGWATKTAVSELITKGVMSSKIVVGKPVSKANADSNSFMSSTSLSAAIKSYSSQSGWKTGLMLYQFASDVEGYFLKEAIKPLISL